MVQKVTLKIIRLNISYTRVTIKIVIYQRKLFFVYIV
jgi:hypothetical protein